MMASAWPSRRLPRGNPAPPHHPPPEPELEPQFDPHPSLTARRQQLLDLLIPEDMEDPLSSDEGRPGYDPGCKASWLVKAAGFQLHPSCCAQGGVPVLRLWTEVAHMITATICQGILLSPQAAPGALAGREGMSRKCALRDNLGTSGM